MEISTPKLPVRSGPGFSLLGRIPASRSATIERGAPGQSLSSIERLCEMADVVNCSLHPIACAQNAPMRPTHVLRGTSTTWHHQVSGMNLNMKPIAALAFTAGCILLLVGALGRLSLNWEPHIANERPLTPVATAPNNTVSLDPNLWAIRYSPGMPPKPSAAPGGGWQFNFPVNAAGVCPAPNTTAPNYDVSPCLHVDYVMTPYTVPIIGSSISMTYSIVAAPGTVFNARTQYGNTCVDNSGDMPTFFSLFIEHAGDQNLSTNYWRWWSYGKAGFQWNLRPTEGTVTVTVPLVLANWSTVYGYDTSATAQAGFADTLANMGNIGMTFGGGCFAGHGAFLDAGGVASFTVTRFRINP